MILTVCGRVEAEEILAAVESVMAGLPEKEPLPVGITAPRVRVSPAAFTPRTATYRQVAKPLFSIGIKYPDPPAGAEALWKRDMTVSVLCETLFSHAGDFYSDLFERGLVSPGTSYGFLVGDSPRLPASFAYGYFDLSGECDDPDEVMAAFLSFVERVREKGLPREDFERAKRVVYADLVATFDTTEDIASLLGSYAQDGLCAYDFFEVMDSITYRDVTELFSKAFRDSQYTLSVILPTEAAD
jgi:predicted Zn-dependent peptidase